MTRAVTIGTAQGHSLRLDHAVRQTHMQVIGLSRTGKSKFLEHLIRQDILAGHGVCLIDPHGELYEDLVDWLAYHGMHRSETVHLVDPCHSSWTVGFNPLQAHPTVDQTVRIDAMVDACTKVWGGTEITQTPQLSRCLQMIFAGLASNGLSLGEWPFFANWSLKDARAALRANITNPTFATEWQEIDEGLTQRQFGELFNSARNRLIEFAKAEPIALMMGQTEGVIDFRKCMDEGHIVLVNLAQSGKLSRRNSQLLGALIASDLYTTAFTRDKKIAKQRPFYFYIDECADYLTNDIASALDQTAKFGLHLVLSHQRIDQLRRYGDDMFNAVMAGAQVKVVFNPDDEEAAERLSRHLFRGFFDVQRTKERITQPVVIGYDIETLEHETVATGWGRSTSRFDGSSSGRGEGIGTVMLFDVDGNQIGGHSASDNVNLSDSTSRGWGEGESESSSQARTRSQVMTPRIEERALTPMSLEEQIHEGIVAIRGLKQREAFLYHRDIGTVFFNTKTVKPLRVFPDEIEDFEVVAHHQSEFTHDREHIKQTLAARRASLSGESGDVVEDADDDALFSAGPPRVLD